MQRSSALLLLGVTGLAACGGGGGTSKPNPYLGTARVTSASAAVTCATPHQVNFIAGGVDLHTLALPGGDCVKFTNNDTAGHWPSSLPAGSCAELDAPSALAAGQSYTSPPLGVVQTCTWQVTELGGLASSPSSFGQDLAGNIYLASVGSGTIKKLTGPTAVNAPAGTLSGTKVFLPLVQGTQACSS